MIFFLMKTTGKMHAVHFFLLWHFISPQLKHPPLNTYSHIRTQYQQDCLMISRIESVHPKTFWTNNLCLASLLNGFFKVKAILGEAEFSLISFRFLLWHIKHFYTYKQLYFKRFFKQFIIRFGFLVLMVY